MIFCERYYSINEFGPEFKISIEELMAESIPNIYSLYEFEESLEKNTKLEYYLFFNSGSNSPIGIAAMQLYDNSDQKKTWIKNLFSFKKKQAMGLDAKWQLPGAGGQGIIFSPPFIKYAKSEISNIFSHLKKKYNISSHELIYPQNLSAFNSLDIFEEHHNISTINGLRKNHAGYADYFHHLTPEVQEEIKNSWKQIHQIHHYLLNEYKDFKSCFAYKKNGHTQFKKLKQELKNSQVINQANDIDFYTLESNDEVECLVALIPGRKGNAFYTCLYKNHKIPNAIAHQMAIMKFYDKTQLNKLHGLDPLEEKEDLTSFGFSNIEQFYLKTGREK